MQSLSIRLLILALIKNARLLLPSRRNRWKRERNFPRSNNRIHMNPNRVFNAPRISPGQSGRNRNPPPPHLFKHSAVTSLQSVLGQRQSTKLVLTKRIRPANIKKYLRLKSVQRGLYRRNQRAKIFVIVNAVRHLQIYIRGRLESRIIIFLMDRERENRSVISKNRRRPVPLMHVRINNNGFSNRSIKLQPSNRHRNIMNRAKPLAMPRVSMMEPAAQIAPKPIA